MFNFLDTKLKPEIKSFSPFEDGYDVTNLISSNPAIRKQGFLAYASIRPPVDININLICSVNLNYIIVDGRNSAQKSTGFELSLKNRSEFSFNSVAQVFLNKSEDGVVFYNVRAFKKLNDYKIPSNYKFIPMKGIFWRLIICCEQIKIRILQTNNIPCIGKVEVWGCISKACSKSMKMQVLNMVYQNKETSSNTLLSQMPNANSELPIITSTEVNGNNDLKIPDEFIDQLTFEVMSLPMTLPSGNTIDKLTLDKHDQSQEIWCRKPFDPFTGQVYTSTCKPVFNSALKNRIDHFLLQNSNNDETKNIPRTVGRANNIESIPTTSNKRTYSEMITNDVTSTNSIGNFDNNLDLILNQAMSKLPRFTATSENEIILNSCFDCKKADNLYKLTCSHLFCRQCLIDLPDKCRKCDKLFKKCDIVRYHY